MQLGKGGGRHLSERVREKFDTAFPGLKSTLPFVVAKCKEAYHTLIPVERPPQPPGHGQAML